MANLDWLPDVIDVLVFLFAAFCADKVKSRCESGEGLSGSGVSFAEDDRQEIRFDVYEAYQLFLFGVFSEIKSKNDVS